MKAFKTSIVMGMTLVSLVGCSTNKDQKTGENKNVMASMKEDWNRSKLERHVKEWPEASKNATMAMFDKYGVPDTIGKDMLVWNDSGDFKRTVIYSTEVQHNFPMPHTDVMEQTINYKAPAAQKVADIWKYDGSVHLRRTEGEMSARCDKEAANYLALNLADDIIQGKKSVEEARKQYAREVMNLKNGNPGKYTQQLVFSPPSTQAGETDVSIMDKVKETRQAQEEGSDHAQ